jgi:transposase-like protein
MLHESEETYHALFRNLKARGLETVWLCVSDAHKGLKNAVKKAFLGCSWQRCKVHFMRNILAHVPHREKGPFAEKLKAIWIEPTREAAMRAARLLIEEYKDRFPRAIEVLQEGLEDALQYLAFSFLDHRKTSSTNIIERLHVEIRRRSRVVGIVPSMESYVRLITSFLIEYAEDWSTGKCYISTLLIEEQRLAPQHAA